MKRLFSVVKLFVLLMPERYRFEISYRWYALGMANQIAVVFLAFVSLSLAISAYFFYQQQLSSRELKCLALNIYHEARGESKEGQYAVAVVTLNRRDAKRYPDDVCRVVYQWGWNKKRNAQIGAFSWTTDQLADIPKESNAWRDAYAIAEEVYNNRYERGSLRDALFYHADYVKPRWARNKTRIAKIGRHIFYK